MDRHRVQLSTAVDLLAPVAIPGLTVVSEALRQDVGGSKGQHERSKPHSQIWMWEGMTQAP